LLWGIGDYVAIKRGPDYVERERERALYRDP